VDCAECKSRLVDAVEGQLQGQTESRVRQHLASCEACRTEFDLLHRGVGVLRDTIPALAPHQAYLTRARMERLMAARSGSAKIFRLVSYRAFVAAAAAAAILVSAAFITAALGRTHQTSSQAPAFAQAPVPRVYVPVVLAATRHGEPGNAVGRISVVEKARTHWVQGPGGEWPVGMDSPGAIVPVHHAFYDPEESPYLW